MIASIAETNKIVVEKSTVPVRAAESVLDILRANHRSGVRYQVMFCEFYECVLFSMILKKHILTPGLTVIAYTVKFGQLSSISFPE